jgi:hypothetical protein
MNWLKDRPSYVKVPAYIVLTILAVVFFPVAIGLGLIYLARKHIRHAGWRMVAIIVLALPTLVFGVAEAAAFMHPSTVAQPPAHNSTPQPSTAKSSATPSPTATPAPPGKNGSLGTRTKTNGCAASGAIEDKACTPGAIFAATKDQICKAGYSSSVRDVPESEKNAVYAEYGVTSHVTGQYEVDHLISLELGGSNDIANLWPEPASPTPGFHQKDVVENSLHAKVCSGQIDLKLAQFEIADNWPAIYNGTYSAPSTTTPQAVAPPPAQPAPVTGGVVKLSTSMICHAPGDAYYDRTTNFTPYPTMDACVAAGGRPSER